MVFNQEFVPGWNEIYPNLVKKIAKVIISSNVYTSPFSQMVQDMETGAYVEDIHLNPGHVLLHDTVTNDDIFTNYFDDLATAIYQVNVDLQYPSSYTEYVVRESFSLLDNVRELITTLKANITTTFEYTRNNQVKQMLYNAYQYGMIDAVEIDDPRAGRQESGRYAVAFLNAIDDFRTEMHNRYIIYNNQVGITDAQKRVSIATEFPYIITFNEYVRDVEFDNAINLAFTDRFRSGNSNQDWANKLIKLNLLDFPNSIPPTDRDQVTGNNVSASNINFFPMPTAADGTPLFSGTPKGGADIYGFVVDPAAIKLFTQLQVMTSWLNPATLVNTNREIYRGIMDLGAFNKIVAITSRS